MVVLSLNVSNIRIHLGSGAMNHSILLQYITEILHTNLNQKKKEEKKNVPQYQNLNF